MEGFLFGTGYVFMVIMLLGIVLVAVRLLPFLTVAVVVFALLQVVLPGVALPNGEPRVWHGLALIILILVGLAGLAVDICSLNKRFLNFFWVSNEPFGRS